MKRWTNGLPGATKRLGANLALRGLSVSQSGCARIPMMARSKIAPLQRPNTLMQLSRSSVLELPLATRGRAIHPGTAAAGGDVGFVALDRAGIEAAPPQHAGDRTRQQARPHRLGRSRPRPRLSAEDRR